MGSVALPAADKPPSSDDDDKKMATGSIALPAADKAESVPPPEDEEDMANCVAKGQIMHRNIIQKSPDDGNGSIGCISMVGSRDQKSPRSAKN